MANLGINLGEENYGRAVLVPDHSPEIIHGGRHRMLGDDKLIRLVKTLIEKSFICKDVDINEQQKIISIILSKKLFFNTF